MAGSAVIGALRVNLGIDTAAFSDGLKKANGKLAGFGKAMKVGLVAVAAAAATATAGLAMAVKGTINTADEMRKAARSIGIPTEELSRLKYAADLSGVSFDGLKNSVKRLSMNMQDALAGTGEGAKAFQQLGISVTGVDGKMKTSSAIMQEVADKFAKMPDGAEKTALAMRLFGKSGADMINMLNGGSAALSKLMGEADSFGQVFTDQMGEQAEAFNDNMARLKGTFGAIAAQVAQALLPHLAAFTDWLVANAPQIAAVAKGIIDFGAAVVSAGVTLVNFITGAWAQFVAGWDALTAKVEDVKARISAFAGLLVQIFVDIPAKMIEIGGQIIEGLWTGIKAKAEAVKEGITGIATGLIDSVKAKLGIHSPSKVMHDVGINIMQGLQNGMDSMKGSLDAGVTDTANGISSAFQSIGGSLAEAIKGTKSWKDVALDALKSVMQFMMSQVNFGSMGGFGGLLQGLLGGLMGFANGGSFKVGGSGGIDSQLVAFKASPNETVNISKPGQMGGMGGVQEIVVRGVFVDDGGVVKGIADNSSAAAASRVERRVPAMVDGRMKQRDTRGVRA